MLSRIRPSRSFRRRSVARAAMLAAFAAGLLTITVAAQNVRQKAISNLQQEAQYRVRSENSRQGARVDLTFNDNPQINRVSNAKVEIRGTGRFSPDLNSRSRPFSYTCVYSTESLKVSQLDYRFEDPNSG